MKRTSVARKLHRSHGPSVTNANLKPWLCAECPEDEPTEPQVLSASAESLAGPKLPMLFRLS